MNAKPFHIKFNKVDGLIKIGNGIRYLELSDHMVLIIEYVTNFLIRLIIL